MATALTTDGPTHPAIVATGLKQPLACIQVPTPKPTANEAKVHVQWVSSTPFDMQQSDGGSGIQSYPQVMGITIGGTVVETGPDVQHLNVGDQVFGFTWRTQKEKAHQLYCVTPENLLGKVPQGIALQEAVTMPDNFVTVWHAFTKDCGFELPWPKPDNYQPPERNKWILIWGGSSSCGMYGLQVLKYYGYNKVIAMAGKAHHATLKRYGAQHCFDYRNADAIDNARKVIEADGGSELGYILDCIGSLEGSVRPVSQLAQSGTKALVLLPVTKRDSAPGVMPEYDFTVEKVLTWPDGVVPLGVRTFTYLNNTVLADRLQRLIMPWMLENKIVEPNRQVVVEGKTLLERAEKAMSMLRNKEQSGARLVWRIAEE